MYSYINGFVIGMNETKDEVLLTLTQKYPDLLHIANKQEISPEVVANIVMDKACAKKLMIQLQNMFAPRTESLKQ